MLVKHTTRGHHEHDAAGVGGEPIRTTSQRVNAGVWLVCAVLSIAFIVLGLLGIIGVRAADDRATTMNNQQGSSAKLLGDLGRSTSLARSTAQSLNSDANPKDRPRLTSLMFSNYVPAIEGLLADVERTHADHAEESATLKSMAAAWATARNRSAQAVLSPGADPTRASLIDAAFDSFNQGLERLVEQDSAEGVARQEASMSVSKKTGGALIVSVVLAVLVTMTCAFLGSRRIRRALKPAQEQVRFADTMQMALDEEEAHFILQRHLERSAPGIVVTVMNRNNSADRLVAVTELPVGSPLERTLEHARPNSCLAVRSGRRHSGGGEQPGLLVCPVCGPCPGLTNCHPLTVGGVVIGSVLVNGAKPMELGQLTRVKDSVGQAAPVLANLRNLAIAELRATTDGLTALPNKRTVGETLMRMLAQASRGLTPLCLLMLDLDHFKDVNDRFGHPVGDQALASVGAALRSVLREGDFAGRNGGEEFAVILPDTDLSGAKVTAEKVRAAVEDIELPGVDVTLTISIGIAAYPEHALTTERLERLADSALYVAKRSGRNRVEVAAASAQPDEPVQPRPSALPAASGSSPLPIGQPAISLVRSAAESGGSAG